MLPLKHMGIHAYFVRMQRKGGRTDPADLRVTGDEAVAESLGE